MWNDADLVTLNPSLATVNASIEVVVRSDSSGSTFAFTDYLSSAGLISYLIF
jgi:phosphate transport system substrate-binding protein